MYLELPTDPKLLGRSAHDRYLWVCLILLAKGSPEQGRIPAWQNDCQYLAKYTSIPKGEVVRALTYFREVGMVDYDGDWLVLRMFAERQQSSDPKAAERMRTLRERSVTVTQNNSEQSSDVHRTLRQTRARVDRPTNVGLTEAEAESRAQTGARAREAPSLFDRFMEVYLPNPDGIGWDRSAAGKAWNRNVPPGDPVAYEGVDRALIKYKASAQVRDGKVMAPATFLDRWRDIEAAEAAPTNGRVVLDDPDYIAHANAEAARIRAERKAAQQAVAS